MSKRTAWHREQSIAAANGEVLGSPFGMMNQLIALRRLAVVQGLLQRIEREVGVHGTAPAPNHDTTAEHVDDKGHIDPALTSRDIGKVRDPRLIGRSALNCRLTRSSGHGALGSVMRARWALPLRTP